MDRHSFVARPAHDVTLGSAILGEIVRLIDWNRVVLEAVAIHEKDEHPDFLPVKGICGWCVREVLLKER